MVPSFRAILAILLVVTNILAPMAYGDVSGLYFRESLFFDRSTSDDNNPGGGGKTTNQRILTSTSLGYVAAGWIYIGATWNYFKVNSDITTASGTNITIDSTYNEYGPTLGYIDEHWNILGTWFLLADKQWNYKDPSGSTAYGRTGAGWMVDLGYRFDIGTGFQVGPTLIYRSITYNNCKDPSSGSTSSCNPAGRSDELMPFFTFSFNFM